MDKSNNLGNQLSLYLFLSHTHWDHIQGLPFFQPAYVKDPKLTSYGSLRKGRFLASILQDQMDYEYFPVGMSAFSADNELPRSKAARYQKEFLLTPMQSIEEFF